MPHISKQKLDQKVYKKLFRQFTDIISNLDKTNSQNLFSELLTETERIMLVKRLATVVMLYEGYSQYVVEKTLKLSSSTVARINLAYEDGLYDSLVTIFKNKKEKRDQFWSTLEILLRGGMPSMTEDRWKHLP